MLKTKVIQNFYERNGSFDKINNSFAGKLLEEGQDPYEFLGYTPLKWGTRMLSAKEVHDLRIAVLRQDLEAVQKVINVESLDKIISFLEVKDMMPVSLESDNVNIPKALAEYVDVLAEYYKRLSSYVLFMGRYMPLRDVISFMKFHPKQVKANVKTLVQDNKGMLLSVERGTFSKPVAYARKLYVSKGLSQKQIAQLHEKALIKAVVGDVKLPDKCVKDPLTLFVAGILDTSMYLQILETAELRGKTYLQFLNDFNFHVPNCEVMYKDLGMILAIVGQNAVVLMENDGKGSVTYTSDLEAKQLCSKALRS